MCPATTTVLAGGMERDFGEWLASIRRLDVHVDGAHGSRSIRMVRAAAAAAVPALRLERHVPGPPPLRRFRVVTEAGEPAARRRG